MAKNDKEIYIAPKIRSVAFQVESGFFPSAGYEDVELLGFTQNSPYQDVNNNEELFFGGYATVSSGTEGYNNFEFEW